MPVDALRLIRKMRGGAQAHLIEASDGHFYVVKFRNNPQHRRILINEWIAAEFLAYLGIATPAVAQVRIGSEFLEANPEAYMHTGKDRRPPDLGWHFGSRYPGDPARTVVYDFLPDVLLKKLENLEDFFGVLAFDLWMGNADSRQAIFYRARLAGAPVSSSAGGARQGLGLVAQMMDNGFVFEGPHWRFGESAVQGLYFRPLVYQAVQGLDAFEPWLQRIRNFPEEVVDRALRSIPPAWLEGDQEALEQLMERLLRRRSRVASLLEDCGSPKADPFPNWRR